MIYNHTEKGLLLVESVLVGAFSLLRDCEIFANLRITFVSSSSISGRGSPEAGQLAEQDRGEAGRRQDSETRY